MRQLFLFVVLITACILPAKAPVKKAKRTIAQDEVVFVIKGKRPPKKAVAPAPIPEPVATPAPVEPAPVVAEPELEPTDDTENKKHVFSVSVAVTANKDKSHGTHSQGGEAWIGSQWGYGGQAAIEYYFTNSFSIFADYSLDKVVFYEPPSTYTLTQAKKYSNRSDLGVKLLLGRTFLIKSHVGIKQDFSFYIATLPNAVIDQFWHGLWGAALGYNLWQNNSVCFYGETGADLYFPTSKSAYSTGFGEAVNTLLMINFKSRPAVYTFFKFEFYQLRASTFTGQSGYRFLGGLGMTFSTTPAKQ